MRSTLMVVLASFVATHLAGQTLALSAAPNASFCEIQEDVKRYVRKHGPTALDTTGPLWQELTDTQKAILRARKETDSEKNQAYAPFGRDSLVVTIFADGTIKSAIADTSGDTRATGAIGVVRSTCSLDFSVLLNVAATDDTLEHSFGASLLAPATGGLLRAGLIDVRVREIWNPGRKIGRIGAHFYASVNSLRWGIPGADTISAIGDIVVLGVGTALTKQILRQNFAGSYVSVSTDLGLSYRGLFGDLAFNGSNALRRRAIGSRARQFLGLEGGFAVQFSQLKGAVQFYYFPGPRIAGMTHGQVVAGLALQGNLITDRTVRE